jgi:hypothetical protein
MFLWGDAFLNVCLVGCWFVGWFGFGVFDTGSLYIAQAILELAILPQPPEY